jgi:hypothetical protein
LLHVMVFGNEKFVCLFLLLGDGVRKWEHGSGNASDFLKLKWERNEGSCSLACFISGWESEWNNESWQEWVMREGVWERDTWEREERWRREV